MPQSRDLKTIYESIEKLEDIQEFVTDTEDGESSILEFKSLRENSFSADKVGETKAILAKEICAFLNTYDGLIVWGVEKDEKTKKLIIKNDTSENLEEFLDKMILTITEPSPKGILFKTIKNSDNKTCLLIYIPRSDLAPHRVGSWNAVEGRKDKDKKTGKYFQRIGTNSQIIPEHIVRAMYLSKGRVPNISMYTKVDILPDRQIRLSTIVKPDPALYINKYYNSNQIALIDQNFRIIRDDEENIWQEIHGVFNYPQINSIYPRSCEYEIRCSYIKYDLEEQDNSNSDESEITPQEETIIQVDDDLHFTPTFFSQIFAIATKSNFSCEFVPLKEEKRLYILGDYAYWNLQGYDIQRNKSFFKLENEFDYKIYVAKPYQDDIYEDYDIPNISSGDGRLRVSVIKQLLTILENNSRD